MFTTKNLFLTQTNLFGDIRSPRGAIAAYLDGEEVCVHLHYFVIPSRYEARRYHVLCVGEVFFWRGAKLISKTGTIANACPRRDCLELILGHMKKVREAGTFDFLEVTIPKGKCTSSRSWRRIQSMIRSL